MRLLSHVISVGEACVCVVMMMGGGVGGVGCLGSGVDSVKLLVWTLKLHHLMLTIALFTCYFYVFINRDTFVTVTDYL